MLLTACIDLAPCRVDMNTVACHEYCIFFGRKVCSLAKLPGGDAGSVSQIEKCLEI